MKKITIVLAFIMCNTFSLFAQINWQHEITIELSSPTQIYDYPDKSQIYRLGYQSIFKTTHFNFGITLLPEYSNFGVAINPFARKELEMQIKSIGGRVGFFVGKKISTYFSIDSFFEYGEYSSAIRILGNGLPSPNQSALRSYTGGIKFKYKWLNHYHLYIKLAYEKYKNTSTTVLQTDPNFGRVIFKSLGVNEILVNGIVPSIGVHYRL